MLVNLKINNVEYTKINLASAILQIDCVCDECGMEYNLDDIISKLSCIEFNLYPKGDRDFSKIITAKITQVK